jgi:hypothetical protein
LQCDPVIGRGAFGEGELGFAVVAGETAAADAFDADVDSADGAALCVLHLDGDVADLGEGWGCCEQRDKATYQSVVDAAFHRMRFWPGC